VTVDATPTAPHPLDPLTEDEVRAATAVWKADPRIPDDVLVHVGGLYEPPKAELASWRPGEGVDRRVRYLLRSKSTGIGYDVVVSATTGSITDLIETPDAHPPYGAMELYAAVEAARADARFVAGCAARGVADMSQVQFDPWPAGRFGDPWEVRPDGRTRRVTRVVGYWRADRTDNGYAHPIDGLIATVDLDTRDVVDVLDVDPHPVPGTPSRYDGAHARSPRGTAKPIEITQPHGTSFTFSAGNHIEWEGWRLRFSMHSVTGLVIHNVTYRGRSIAHRLSIAEMVVPYAGQSPNTRWKNTFDAGELSMGRYVNSLELGCDCLGDITYADWVFVNEFGDPYTRANVVCLHEEDTGLAWKHTDPHSGGVEVRRGRRFVVNSVITAGNYEYGFRWCFHTDGRVQLEVQLTGIIQTERALDDGRAPEGTRLVLPGLAGAHHQHLFCARLDLDIDGSTNSVIETEIVPSDGHAWEQSETVVETEGSRDADAARQRRWKFVNPSVTNAVGEPVGYELVPAGTPTLIAAASTSVAKRAAFATHAVWVTAYDPAELHAASDCANLHGGGAGLPSWVQQQRPVVAADVVLWHSFGATHVVRPEDFPVMPTEVTGFMLRPHGFFPENPALDIDPPAHCHSRTSDKPAASG
jgi:primary-amine oxidase